MRRIFLVMVTAVVLACGQAAVPADPKATNVSGMVDRGPLTHCPTAEPCDPPARAVFLVFSRAGYADVRTQVGATGDFALHLDPGAYSIAAAPPLLTGRIVPDNVRVPAQGSVTLMLTIG